jgi:hypothetical protein
MQVEGVGTGAVAAAALHADFDLAALATWAPGARVPFAFLAATFESISAESKRHAITRMLINAFRAVLATTPDDLLPAVYLCVNQARGALLAPSPRVCPHVPRVVRLCSVRLMLARAPPGASLHVDRAPGAPSAAVKLLAQEGALCKGMQRPRACCAKRAGGRCARRHRAWHRRRHPDERAGHGHGALARQGAAGRGRARRERRPRTD